MTADQLIRTFGSAERVAPGIPLSTGPVTLLLSDGDLRQLRFGGVEVLRRLSYPVRDKDWGTLAIVTVSEETRMRGAGLAHARAFRSADGSVEGTFDLDVAIAADGAVVTARIAVTALRDVQVNRCGFTLLHPLAGVTGEPMTVFHPDGGGTRTVFPDAIRPDQPARNVAGLAHDVRGVAVDIRMTGDVFEMEDQRNWSDASFKTYCRPLSRPRPYRLAAGEVVRQGVRISLSGTPLAVGPGVVRGAGRMPDMAIAHEPGISSASAVPGLEGMAMLLRVRADVGAEALARAVPAVGELTLEVVLPAGMEAAAAFAGLARCCLAAGLAPARVVAAPEAYLASHQPEGPWPAGPGPDDLIGPLARAFPGVTAGAGCLTHFTELNRCRPDMAAAEFLTFGGSAIVHAADDISVVETLETLPEIFASARMLSEGKPIRLGLVGIGMRANPYGASVAANPELVRVPMAIADPRQDGLFAAAWAVGVLAAAAEGGIAGLALAMTDGPLGAVWSDGAIRPLFHVIRAAREMAGADVTVERQGAVLMLTGGGRMIAANIGGATAALTAARGKRVRVLDADGFGAAAADPAWIGGPAAQEGAVLLAPFAVAFGGFGRG